jgi:hypothetical protein
MTGRTLLGHTAKDNTLTIIILVQFLLALNYMRDLEEECMLGNSSKTRHNDSKSI